VILHRVVRPTRQDLRDGGPAIAQLLVRREQRPLLRGGKGIASQRGV
jgi:hypothetical protein